MKLDHGIRPSSMVRLRGSWCKAALSNKNTRMFGISGSNIMNTGTADRVIPRVT